MTLPRPKVAILGGGPGGYEAALVAAQLGADVTVVDEDGLGGACVLTDCVPSKTLIESSSTMTSLGRSASASREKYDSLDQLGETVCASEKRIGSFGTVDTVNKVKSEAR